MDKVLLHKWKKEQLMDKESIIRFQILVYCHFEGKKITQGKLDCLTIIGTRGEADLNPLSEELAEKKIFSSPQSARNVLGELEELGLLNKKGVYRKKVTLHPDMKIQNTGNIMLDIKCLSREI